MIIDDILYLKDKRIYLAGKSKDYDITSYAIELMMKWYIETGYHITKSITTEEKEHALMYSDDEEVMNFVQNYYSIKKEDFTATSHPEKEELYQISPYKQRD